MVQTAMEMLVQQDFEAAFSTFVSGCQQIIRDYYKAHASNLQPDLLTIERGKRYVRVVKSASGSRSVYCFVDQTNGDVLKAASWRAPANHARGNIFNEKNGLGWMGVYGPAYLK